MGIAEKSLIWILLIFLCCRGEARAEGNLRLLSEDLRELAWSLTAERVATMAGGSVLEAFGQVEISQDGDSLRADMIRYFPQTNWVYLSGNVRITLGQDQLEAREAEFDLRSRTGWLTDGRITIAEPRGYFQGEHIAKYRGNIYSFQKLKYSACDGETPAWSFAAGEAVLELNGYAQLRDVRFQLADQPVLYTPYLIVPAKTERQTGFLLPDYLNNSKNGFTLTLPFFWVLDSSRDLTLYESYMSRRGAMHGLVYRSKDSEDENLWLGFDYLHDRRTIGSEAEDRYYRNDGLIRKNSERWWLRGMYEARLPEAPLWRLRADLDYVSDQYYLRDFQYNLTSLKRSNADLFRTFSRELQGEDQNRVSGFLFFREWKRAGVYLSGAYTQDPRLGNSDPALTPAPVPTRKTDPTAQKLPALDIHVYQGRLLDSLPLEWQASAQGAYFYRQAGDRGSLLDLSPRLILPVSGTYGAFSAAARLRSTWYETENGGQILSPREKLRLRPEADIQASTEFFRVYRLADAAPSDRRWTALRHGILPRLAYRYSADQDQGKYPFYTESDLLLPQNDLVFTLDNVLTLKSETPAGAAHPEASPVVSYQDILRLRLEQSYDIREARATRGPWRDLLADLALTSPAGNLTLQSVNYYTPREHAFTRQNHSLTLTWPDQGSLSARLNQYRPIRDADPHRSRDYKLTTAGLAGSLLFSAWSASMRHDWPIAGTDNIRGKKESGLTLSYLHQCFLVSGEILRSDNDTSFRLVFNLSGLGL